MYKLTISKEQAEVLIKALELFSRIGTGQFRDILRHPTWRKKIATGEINIAGKKLAERSIDDLSIRLNGGVVSTQSIITANEPDRVAYDMEQVVRHRLAHDENPDGVSVWHAEPLRVSHHGLPEIREEE